MTQLEDIICGTTVKGILRDALETVVDVRWIGTLAIAVTYTDSMGKLPGQKVGKYWRFRKVNIDKWLSEDRQQEE